MNLAKTKYKTSQVVTLSNEIFSLKNMLKLKFLFRDSSDQNLNANLHVRTPLKTMLDNIATFAQV